jgi:hypothetical protein
MRYTARRRATKRLVDPRTALGGRRKKPLADPNATPDLDPFAQLASSKDYTSAPQASSQPQPKDDPFAELASSKDYTQAPQTSATGAFTRSAARGVLPALGSLPAMAAGAELGAAAGTPLAPFTGGLSIPALTIAGGLGGAFGGAALVGKLQDYALKALPDSWQDKLGMSDRQQQLDEKEHSAASFLGGIAPYALTMKPGISLAKAKLPENATALQRIMANPATKVLFGGGAMGGIQLAQEKVSDQGEGINWNRVAIATGFGMVFNRPTRFGERITGPATELTQQIPWVARQQSRRAVQGLYSAAAREAASPTLNEAADAKVMGPGVTEPVFQGAHAQDPAAEMTAQQAVRDEQAVLGTQPASSRDLHATARAAHPELFDQYDALVASRDTFRQWLNETADTESAAVATLHLHDLQGRIDAMAPEIQAAYRRAEEATGTPPGERPGAPERFPTFAAMLAAHGEERPPAATAGAETPAAAATGIPSAEVGATPSEGGVRPQPVPPRSIAEQRDFIAQDVARQLAAAGRPPAEANQAGKLWAHFFETAAKSFNGALGSPEELYRREGAEISGRKAPPTAPATTAEPAPPLAPGDQAKAQNLDVTKDVVSGANSSKDPNGPVVIDRRIPQFSPTVKDRDGNPANLWNLLQLHERVETEEMAKGKTYDEAHKIATAAERELAERTGIDWSAYTKEMDGYLSHIEGEKVENPPTDTHIDPQEAIGHHRSENKLNWKRMMSVAPLISGFEKSGMIENAETYRDAAKKRREESAGGSVRVFTSAEARARHHGTTVKEEGAKQLALQAEHGPRFDAELKTEGVEPKDLPKNIRETAIEAMANLHMEPGQALDYAMLKDEHEARIYEDEHTKLVEAGLIQHEEGHAADVGDIPFETGGDIAREGEGRQRRGEEEVPATGGAARYAGARFPEEVEFFQHGGKERDLIAEREAEGQQQIPGADRISQAELVQRRANAPLKPSVPQKPADEGLFGDEGKQKELFQSQLGKITFREGMKPIMELAQSSDPSTFIHESGHLFLELMTKWAEHPQAPDALKADLKTTLDWLGVESPDAIKTRHHEKFARGFEQYLREGVSPSPELASVFSQFREWLLKIYQTIRGLGSEITPEIRGVFDRLLASEPQRTVIAPERAKSPTLADIHEGDAAHTEPHEAEPAGDRILKEAEAYASNIPRSVIDEHAASEAKQAAEATAAANEPGGQAGASAVTEGALHAPGGGPEPVAGGSAGGAAAGAELHGGGNAVPEGAGQQPSGERPGEPSHADANLGDKPLAPRPKPHLGAAESPFLDKAGNIRIENLTTREDVAQAIRDAAKENNDFIGDRRGIVTDGQVMDLAEDIGMAGAEKMLRERITGQAFNAEQIMAARKLLVDSAMQASAAMKKAATGTDEDVMAYAQAKDRHQMIQGQIAGITAEAGRALRAFRNITGMSAEAQAVDQILRDSTGKTLFQLRREAKLGATLTSPQQVSKFMADAQKPTFGRMILEYWINGLISGPATHATYAIGNTILAAEKAGPETAAAAAIGAVRRAMGRGGETVRLGEVAAQFKAGVRATVPATKAFLEALRTGTTVALPGEQGAAQNVLAFPGAGLAQPALYDEAAKFSDVMASAFGIVRGIRDGMIAGAELARAAGVEPPLVGLRHSPLGSIPDIEIAGYNVLPISGTILRLPSRGVAAIHSFFRGINYSMEKAADAYRTASNEGLTGTAFDARVADIHQNPSQAQMERYAGTSSELTLMGQGGEFTRALSRLTNAPIFGLPLLKFIDPFVHISSNVIQKAIIERTPVGILSPELRADLMGRNGNIAQDTAMARMLVGTAYAVGLGALAAEGYVSGSGPSDPRQAATWRLAGNQAHSVRVGDIWYDVHRLGPLGMLLGISADLYDVSHAAAQGDMILAASHLQHAITQNVLDESFMRGLSDLIRAVEDPGRYGEAYVRNFLSSFVPYSVGLAQIARASDPYSRQARTVMDEIKQKIPGLSESLLPRRDIWGNEVANKDALISAGVTAIYEQRVSRDPVNLALLDLGIYPAQLQRKVRNVDLTDQQYDDFQRIAGRMTKMRLDAIVNAPDYRTWPNHVRHDVISEVIAQSREAARGMLMMKYPEIPREAAQMKLDKARGVEK